MDNFSEEKNEEDVNPQISETPEDSDIQFEEVIDVDKIQKELRLQFGEGTPEDELPTELQTIKTSTDFEIGESTEFSLMQEKAEIELNRVEVNPKDKKYVVYINHDNIDFMETLSPAERKEVVNRILKEQNSVLKKKKIADEQSRFVKHLIVATTTFIIGVPLMFIVVNKAMEFTMQNYKQAKSNITRLYKEQGKIKPTDSSAASKFKY